jgi:hypothetical protein
MHIQNSLISKIDPCEFIQLSETMTQRCLPALDAWPFPLSVIAIEAILNIPIIGNDCLSGGNLPKSM